MHEETAGKPGGGGWLMDLKNKTIVSEVKQVEQEEKKTRKSFP